MKETNTNNGKRGGLLKGKPHYDKDGNSLGGIKAVVTDAGGKPVELEGGEVIINKEASKKYWKQLSKINQSAGNGVPIGPPMGADEDPEEFKDGGRVIEFNPNHIPNKWVVKYAVTIKENHPEIWALGGNIFGNEAFINLNRVIERGHWLDSEEWMYIKWRSYVARHKQDFRIAGVVAMLKWCDKVDKGWAYMKDLIEEKIENIKSKETSTKLKMETGGEVKRPIEEISGVLLNHLKKYSQEVYGEDIDDSSFMLMAIKEDNKYQAKEVSATTKSGKKIHITVQELYMETGGEVQGDDFLEVKRNVLQKHPKNYDIFKGGKVDGYKIVKMLKKVKFYGTLHELWLLDTKKNKLGGFNKRIVFYYPQNKRISDFFKIDSSTTQGNYYDEWNDKTLEGKMSKGGEIEKVNKTYTIQGVNLKKGDKFQVSDDSSIYTFHGLQKNERFGFDNIVASSDWEDIIKPIWRIDTMESNNLFIRKYSKGGEIKNSSKQVVGYTKLGNKIYNTDEFSSYQRLDLEYNVPLTEREKMTSRTKWIELNKEIDDHALAGKGKISKMSSSERKVYSQKLEKLKIDRKLYHDNYKEDLFDYLKLNPRTQTTFEKKLVKAKKSLEDARKNNSWSVMSAIEEEIKRGERIVFEEVKLGKEFNPKVGANAMNSYSPFPTTEFEQFKGSSKMSKGGELSKGIRAEKEHQDTIDNIYSHKVKQSKAAELIAKDHLKEDKKYYSKLEKMEGKKFAGGGNADRPDIKVGDIVTLESKRKGLFNVEILYITEKWITFNDITNNVKNTSNETPKFYESFRGFVDGSKQPEPVVSASAKIKEPVVNTVDKTKLEPTGIPSTDPSTWSAEYKVGDVVKIRIDFERSYPNKKTDGSKVSYLDDENSWTITKIETETATPYKEDKNGNNIGGFMRKENPSGKLYVLSNYEGGAWEGKDLELVYLVDNKQTQQASLQKQAQTPTVKKQVKTIEPEPIKRKFDSDKDYLAIYTNYFEKDNATSTKVTDKMKRSSIIQDFVLSTEGIGGFDKEKLKKVYSYINEK